MSKFFLSLIGKITPERRKIYFYLSFADTWIAAIALSFIWTVFWLGIFLFSTWYLNITTSINSFVVALWMSVSAEAVIRYAENADWAVIRSKPMEVEPEPDNADHNWFRAFSMFMMAGLLMVFAYGFLRSHFNDSLDRISMTLKSLYLLEYRFIAPTTPRSALIRTLFQKHALIQTLSQEQTALLSSQID